MPQAIVLLGVAEDTAIALQRALRTPQREVIRVHAWNPEAAASDVAAVVVDSSDAVGVVISLRRSTAAPLLLLCRDLQATAAVALDAGADACLDRRAAAATVVAQTRALLRRATTVIRAASEAAIEVGSITIEPAARIVSAHGAALKVTPREFDLLAFLVSRPGRAVRRDELLAAVWGPRYAGATNTVDVHIAWLRQKLPEDAGIRITTLRGVGYRLDVLASVSGAGLPNRNP